MERWCIARGSTTFFTVIATHRRARAHPAVLTEFEHDVGPAEARPGGLPARQLRHGARASRIRAAPRMNVPTE